MGPIVRAIEEDHYQHGKACVRCSRDQGVNLYAGGIVDGGVAWPCPVMRAARKAQASYET